MTLSTVMNNISSNLTLPSIFVNQQTEEIDELKPFYVSNHYYHLPPIYYNSPTISSVASSPTPLQEEEEEPKRKGSIASLLNYDNNKSYQQQQHKQNKKQRTRVIKGLRHFSKQVCDKVAEKGTTTYNDVANELSTMGTDENPVCDQKNIRRRVYDALNVLMAMDIISKDKKVIKWIGIQNDHEQELLKEIEKEQLRQNDLMCSIDELRTDINNQLDKHSKIRDLINRNQSTPKENMEKIALPFFLIKADNPLDLHHDSKSALITFQQNTKVNIYKDSDILNQLQL